MNRLFCWLLLAAILVQRGYSVPTEPTDEDDDDWDEDEESSEADDDSRIYKNPRNSPSTECPRDEEQATLLGQKCLRKCSSDEDCKSKKKKCLCDGACGMSCIKPDRECPELTQPSLGTVTLSGRHFGGRATYTCPHGYHVVGLQSRSCQADGHWAGQEPACKQNIYCLTPPTIEHARHSALPEQATFDLDSTVQYHCHTGYVTAGFPRAKCLAIDGQASWYGPDIQCEPRSCGQPPDPASGWHAGECYTFGCRVTYHCSEGYELVGKLERFCQADGSWTPKELPTCVLVTAVQCTPPENPKNGKAIYTSTSYNSVVSYECRYGYTLVGESSRRCGADRKWSGQLPTCKEINCGHPGVLYNGWLENIEAGTGLGASIIYRCHPGMLLVGNTSTVCQIDGRWRYGVPECLAPCMVPTISQGTVIPMEVEMDPNITTTFVPPTLSTISNKVRHGTTLEVMCEDHYEFPVSSQSPPTCNNGTWSIIPRCIPARCKGLPKPPKFGMVLAPKTEHGMKARFKCKDGFNLIGPTGKEITDPNEYVLTCSFGNWTGETPMCQEVYCSFPGYIPHGKILLVGNMGLYDYRPYVKKIINNKQIMYDCDKGYVLGEGPQGATCVGGVWRPTELPSCYLGQHPRLRWNRRRRSLQMKFARSQYLQANYRRLHRKINELLDDKQPEIDNHQRTKRSYHVFDRSSTTARLFGINKRQRYLTVRRNHNLHGARASDDDSLNHKRVSRTLNDVMYRQIRQTFTGDEAYAKYLAKIKQKYQKYVKNILGHNNVKQNYSLTNGIGSHVNGEGVKHQYSNPEMVSRVHMSLTGAGHNSRSSENTEVSHPKHQPDHPSQRQHRIQNINYRPSKAEQMAVVQSHQQTMYNNTYENDDPLPDIFAQNQYKIGSHQFGNGADMMAMYHHRMSQHHQNVKPNTSELIAKLNAQTVRRKRSASDSADEILDRSGGGGERRGRKNGRRNMNATVASTAGASSSGSDVVVAPTVGDVEGDDGFKRGKPKSPCEAIPLKPYMRVDIVREGRDPASEFSAGTIVKVTCAKEYILNLQNPNGTVKCVRGRWKPMIPQCTLQPCTVPSAEHGSYLAMSATDPSLEATKHGSTKLLIAFEEIHNGDIIDFQCDDGYNVQGPNQLKCWHGNWDVNTLPECQPSPCSLPNIANAVYQGGYRGGLTIAHGSSVIIQCENPANNLPVQMVCALGQLSPPSIHCGTGARRSREEYLAEVEFVSTDQEVNGLLNSFSMGKLNNAVVNANGNGFNRVNLDTGRDCGSPSRIEDALVYKNGEPVAESESGFQSGTEITFNCIASVAGERTTWKIICEDGTWVGRSLNCANGTCIFRNNEPNVVSFYNDLEIREEVVEFPPGAIIISRCADIGKYSMTGSSMRQCIHSEWNGQRPVCFGLNQENDYAMEKAPTILFRHHHGPIAQSNDGKLIVYPGTTVHMECLWMRRFGNPKWIVSHEYRNYPEGWVADEGRDSTLEYRLSIFHAVEDDSGIFKCQTPARHEHAVDVLVKAINCPEIPPRRGLTVSTNDTKMSTRAMLSCANGNSLIGASELICLPSGNWSAPLPVCESVECGDLPLAPSTNRSAPRVAVLSREVGGRAAFSCKLGFGIRGPSESICLPSGEWATPFPTCVEVQCENPGAPANGYAQGSAPYRAGDVVQFNCNPEYMMQGQPIIACQDNGRWSGVLPKCVQACSYPGTAIAGRMSSVKFYYAIGESITFTCDAGLDLRGAKMLKCLRNGKWSNAIPTCVNPDSSGHSRNSGAALTANNDRKDHH